jgi:hypothetical protein
MNNLLSVILDRPCQVSQKVGSGVQLFRIRHPKLFFKEVATLPGMRDESIVERRVWKVKDEDVYYALLTIPYKDEEKILVRAPNANWEEWDWKQLASQADACRWKGPSLDSRYVL